MCGYFTSKGERPWRPISEDWLEYVEEDPESGAMSWDIEATELRRCFGRRLQRAVREANSARFEFGETPGRRPTSASPTASSSSTKAAFGNKEAAPL